MALLLCLPRALGKFDERRRIRIRDVGADHRQTTFRANGCQGGIDQRDSLCGALRQVRPASRAQILNAFDESPGIEI